MFYVVNAPILYILAYAQMYHNVYIIYHLYGTYGCAIEEPSEILLLCGHETIDKRAMYTFLMAWQTKIKTACAADKAPL